MNNMNFDENTINKLKDMMNKGELNDVISQIPPEIIQNFSSMMNNNNNNSQNNTNNSSNNTENSTNSFDFNNIDMNTIMKMKSFMEKMNNTNDPRSNLLHSLKPYLRESRKEKLDQYVNLLNISKIADVLKTDKKENDKNG